MLILWNFFCFLAITYKAHCVSCDNGNELTWIRQCAIRPLSCHRVLETGLQPANAPSTPASREKCWNGSAQQPRKSATAASWAHWNPLYCDNCTLIGTGLEMTRPAYRHNQECPADFGFHSKADTKTKLQKNLNLLALKSPTKMTCLASVEITELVTQNLGDSPILTRT